MVSCQKDCHRPELRTDRQPREQVPESVPGPVPSLVRQKDRQLQGQEPRTDPRPPERVLVPEQVLLVEPRTDRPQEANRSCHLEGPHRP
jgi:hypothetical protein